jgi:hypothetical protein
MSILNRPPWQESVSLASVTQAYIAAANDPAQLSNFDQALAAVPMPLHDVIPSAKEVIEQKTELDQRIQQTRSSLQ